MPQTAGHFSTDNLTLASILLDHGVYPAGFYLTGDDCQIYFPNIRTTKEVIHQYCKDGFTLAAECEGEAYRDMLALYAYRHDVRRVITRCQAFRPGLIGIQWHEEGGNE